MQNELTLIAIKIMTANAKSLQRPEWRSLKVSSAELRLDFTLQGGQSFRWHQRDASADEPSKCWTGVFGDRVWTLSQRTQPDVDHDCLLYRVHPEPLNNEQVADCERAIKDYFQLDTAILADLYYKWSASDVHFCKIAPHYPGVRVLRQDPVENLFSFLCSSNNNIKRITGMVESLCRLYGRELATVDGQTYHRFPEIESLASDCVAQRLRSEKFGYRAEFIQRAAKKLVDDYAASRGVAGLTRSSSVCNVNDWLRRLRTVSYEDARGELMALPGVGPKVADCVCLMSLDKSTAIPVDTHIFKLASHLYFSSPAEDGGGGGGDLVNPKSKSLTKTKYDQIGKHFNDVFGQYAGWAHSVLFTSDLSQFQLTNKTVNNNVKRSSKRDNESPTNLGRKSSKKKSK